MKPQKSKFSLSILKYNATKATNDYMLPRCVWREINKLDLSTPVEYVNWLKDLTYIALKQKGFYRRYPDFGRFAEIIDKKRKEVFLDD